MKVATESGGKVFGSLVHDPIKSTQRVLRKLLERIERPWPFNF
jgi:hypothetical protein